jgi:hypothetical protein
VNLWRALVGQFSGLERPLVELPPEALMQVPAGPAVSTRSLDDTCDRIKGCFVTNHCSTSRLDSRAPHYIPRVQKPKS